MLPIAEGRGVIPSPKGPALELFYQTIEGQNCAETIEFFSGFQSIPLDMKTEPSVCSIEEVDDLTVTNMIKKMKAVYKAESLIDPDRELYMITWSPDPKKMPNSSFLIQHEYNINVLADYLKYVEVGIWTVESTQRGNPHYHGFYQPSDDSNKEFARLAIIKTLDAFGDLKITKSIGKYKINNWHTPRCNCLYYYKKDVGGSMFNVESNPITRKSRCKMDFTNLSAVFFTIAGRHTAKEIQEKASQRDRCLQFYAETVKDYQYTTANDDNWIDLSKQIKMLS